MKLTPAQTQRLHELNCTDDLSVEFESVEERDKAFRSQEQELLNLHRQALFSTREQSPEIKVFALAQQLSSFLRQKGFLEVSTPIVISRKALEKMISYEGHPLLKQVFYLDKKTCLRPMLAPNLYDVSNRLLKIFPKPLGVFEIGPCFRKESQGKNHLNEFTMINFVEWGVPEEEKHDRMRSLATQFMETAGLPDFQIVEEESVVYGKTFDVLVDDIEIASGAFGPHSLDEPWEIDETWLGLGSGLERIIMLRDGLDSVQKVGRGLRYQHGLTLNIK